MNQFLKALKKQEYFENFITRSIKNSNAIEGNTLSYAQIYSIVFNDESLPLQNVNPRELYETINLKYALNCSLENINKFDKELIISIGNLINKNIKDTSGFRKIQNYIRGADFVPVKPEYVSNRIDEIIYEYNNSNLEKIEKIAKFHIDFEHIHPFEDGNGRTGRVLLNHQLIMNEELPVVIPEEKRIEYFNFLANYDIYGLSSMIKELQVKEREKINDYNVLEE
ncbi:MAG: Fic family protein [Bacilli bacterium]